MNKTLEERFEENEERLNFDKVKNKRSNRVDIHVFLLLDELFPGDCDVISNAAHDKIWLEPGKDELNKLTNKQILELSRCGVMCEDDSLIMFV